MGQGSHGEPIHTAGSKGRSSLKGDAPRGFEFHPSAGLLRKDAQPWADLPQVPGTEIVEQDHIGSPLNSGSGLLFSFRFAADAGL
jgi:hypothetical protein